MILRLTANECRYINDLCNYKLRYNINFLEYAEIMGIDDEEVQRVSRIVEIQKSIKEKTEKELDK